MNALRPRPGPLMIALGLVSAVAAAELPVAYLIPDRFTTAAEQPVLVRVEAGSALAARTVTWPADRLKWFFVRADGTQENHDTVPAANREQTAAAVNVSRPCVTVIGLDARPAVVRLAGAELCTFLTRNVAGAAENPEVRRLADRPNVRVRRVESATTMVRVPAGDLRDQSSAVAQRKTGQAVEIQALFDPTMLTVGSDLPVRVFIRGTKQSDARVQGSSAAGGLASAPVTDSAGTTHIRITHAGIWRIEFHHGQPLANDPEADWIIYSATLTFEVAKPAAADGAPVTGEGAKP